MAKKKKLSKSKPTAVVRVSLPKVVTDASFDQLRKAYDLIRDSETSHYAVRLEEVMDSNHVLQQWEVDQLNKVFEKFAAKYNSPLAKALK